MTFVLSKHSLRSRLTTSNSSIKPSKYDSFKGKPSTHLKSLISRYPDIQTPDTTNHKMSDKNQNSFQAEDKPADTKDVQHQNTTEHTSSTSNTDKNRQTGESAATEEEEVTFADRGRTYARDLRESGRPSPERMQLYGSGWASAHSNKLTIQVDRTGSFAPSGGREEEKAWKKKQGRGKK